MTLQLQVPNMACSGCVDTITQAIANLDPIAQVQTDLKSKLVTVTTEKSADSVKQAIISAGYQVS